MFWKSKPWTGCYGFDSKLGCDSGLRIELQPWLQPWSKPPFQNVSGLRPGFWSGNWSGLQSQPWIETLKPTGFDFCLIATLGVFYGCDYGFGFDRNLLKVFPDRESFLLTSNCFSFTGLLNWLFFIDLESFFVDCKSGQWKLFCWWPESLTSIQLNDAMDGYRHGFIRGTIVSCPWIVSLVRVPELSGTIVMIQGHAQGHDSGTCRVLSLNRVPGSCP